MLNSCLFYVFNTIIREIMHIGGLGISAPSTECEILLELVALRYHLHHGITPVHRKGVGGG